MAGVMKFVAVMIVMTGLTGCTPAPEIPESRWEYGRLVEVQSKNVSKLYRDLQADLSKYQRVILDEPIVAFRGDWHPENEASLSRVSIPDSALIRKRLAELLQQSFAAELQRGGYGVVAEPAVDVLEVRIEIIDLYISYAGIAAAAGRSAPYWIDPSQMTLVVELRDSVNGAVIARAYDQQLSRETNALRLENGAWSSVAAQNAASHWASLLRRALDASRGKKQ
jgi:hypothetical protein